MSDVLAELQALRAKATEAEREAVRREADLDRARQRLSEIGAEMQERFGVSPQEAPARLEQMRGELSAEVERLRKELL